MNASGPGAAGHRNRVLVLDDHGLSRDYTVAALRQGGHAVKAAADPATAFSRALLWLPQVVVVDIDLPEIDGWTWIHRLLGAWPEGAARPHVVVLSADPGIRRATASQDDGSGHRAPADVILRKPASPAALLAAAAGPPGPGAGPAPSLRPRNPLRPVLRRGLRRGLQSDLCRHLPLLDERLTDRDFEGAASLLHRLIASSRICGLPRLEARLGDLYDRVRDGDAGTVAATEIAAPYFALLASAARWQALCSQDAADGPPPRKNSSD